MASTLNGIRNLALLDLGKVVPNKGGIRSWLPNANVVPTKDDTSEFITFDLPYFNQMIPYLAGDFSRFSLASTESLFRSFDSGPSNLNFLGWRLLELYYSGFFAAHALMRALGCGVIVIDQSNIDRFRDIGNIYELPLENLNAGSMYYRVRPSGNSWSFEISNLEKGKGVHDAFWRQFCRFILDHSRIALEDGLPDADQFVTASVELVEAISIGSEGSASWLASLRNEINYRHEHQVWFPPNKKNIITIADLTNAEMPFENFKPDLSKTRTPLLAFENTLSHLAYLSFEMSRYIALQSRRNGFFGASFNRICSMR